MKISGGRAVVGPTAESVVGRAHYDVEEAMKKSGIGWLILRPGLFMQNTLAQAPVIKGESKMVLPFPKDVRIAFVDTLDSRGRSRCMCYAIRVSTPGRPTNTVEFSPVSPISRTPSLRFRGKPIQIGFEG